MKDLPPHILKPEVHWQRAQGYLEMYMYEDAQRELRALPDEEPWAKRSKVFFLSIHQELKNWEDAQKVARSLRYEFSEEVDWWIADAYATRRYESINEAQSILLEGLALHFEDGLIRFNLACYACVLKKPGECIDFLKEAVKRDEKFKLMALEDEDLADVRDALIKLGWGNAIV
jgi:lipopolysaccharide biosynthesis regulator YciM